MRINVKLNEKSINDAINQIEKYKQDLLKKCDILVRELASQGIDVARQNSTGTFSNYVTFRLSLENTLDGITGVIIATDNGTIPSVFKHGGKLVTVDISPLLMMEFGSGLRASNPKGVEGVGQGTLNTYGHAFDKNGWYFIKEDGSVIHSYGYTPHQPMYKALLEIEEEFKTTVKKVFG